MVYQGDVEDPQEVKDRMASHDMMAISTPIVPVLLPGPFRKDPMFLPSKQHILVRNSACK